MRLEELIGQDQAVTVLRRAIATARVPHAYLFEGPPGVGKRTAAIGLAMALNCESPPLPQGGTAGTAGTACGGCESCRRIAAGIHPDVVTFAAEGTQLLMEQAQEIVALGQRRPHEGRARVIVIDGADTLNANASNCLLKTLEEPSPGTHLVLITAAPDRLLATIRSRTQRVRFRRVPVTSLLEFGASRGMDREAAQVAAVVADGAMARFLELSQEMAAASSAESSADAPPAGARDATATLRQAARGRGIAVILDAAVALGDKESKHRLPEALSLLARVYRDALVTVVGAPELAVLGGGPEEPTPRADTAGAGGDGGANALALPLGLPVPALGRALVAVTEAEAALAGNVNAVMALERLLLNLRKEERMAP